MTTVRHGTSALFHGIIAVIVAVGMVAGLPAASQAADNVDVYVTFEGYNLGQGYYIEPVKVTVPTGHTAAQVTAAVLADTGHDIAPGSGDPASSGFFLQGVAGFDTGTVELPDYLVDNPDFELADTNGDGYLGVGDYHTMAGWMLTVDNGGLDAGAGAYQVSDGEVLRWQFSLFNYGCDLGVAEMCFGASPYFTMTDRSELIRDIAVSEAPEAAVAAATAVAIDQFATAAEIEAARDALRDAAEAISAGPYFNVTKGATVGLHRKTGLHFAAFDQFDLVRIDSLCDQTHDVYAAAEPLPNGTNYNITVIIPGQTEKVARVFTVNAASAETTYTIEPTPLADRAETPLQIPGLGAGDPRNLYTNLDDTGVVRLDVGETFTLDTYRTAQAQNDQFSNYFIEPAFDFDVHGDAISTEEVGSEGRRRLEITGSQPGVAIVGVTYGPLKYIATNGNAYDFNGIEEQNTGLVVVTVGDTEAGFDTGIEVRNDLDTFYFDESVGAHSFTFTPDEGTTVRVHAPINQTAWGEGWTTYQPDAAGDFTIDLTAGRNVIELTNDGAVQYRVVRAKGVDVTIENTTNPGESFTAGDEATITVTGVEGGLEKIAGIYNIAFGADSRPRISYTDGATELTSNVSGQYASVTTPYVITYPYAGDEATLTGHAIVEGLGAAWPYHREIPLEGRPANLSAGAIGPYQIGALPPIYVGDGTVTTTPPAVPVDPTALQGGVGHSGGTRRCEVHPNELDGTAGCSRCRYRDTR